MIAYSRLNCFAFKSNNIWTKLFSLLTIKVLIYDLFGVNKIDCLISYKTAKCRACSAGTKVANRVSNA